MCPSRGQYYSSSSYSGYSNYNSYYDDDYSSQASGRRRHQTRDTRHYDDYRDHYNSSGRRSPVYDDYRDYGPSYHDTYIGSPTDDYRRYTSPPRHDYDSHYRRRSDRSRSPRRRRDSSPYDQNPRDKPDPLPSRRSPLPPPPRRTEPTEEYNETSSQSPGLLSDPISLPKLLVLDLNGTLVLRGDRRQAQSQRFSHPRAYAKSGPPPRPLRAVYPRPYLGTFKDFIFHPETKKWLDTMVWSSAQPHSVADMVAKCFSERRDELKGVWARDTLGLTHAEYNQKTQTTKDLDKIWKEVSFTEFGTQDASPHSSAAPSPRPRSTSPVDTPDSTHSRRHSAKTTLLMDDSPLKAILQPWNHLCIPEYDAEMRKRDMSAEASHSRREQSGSTALEDAQAQLDAMNEIVEAGPVVEDGMTERAAKRKLKKQKKALKKMEDKAQRLSSKRPEAHDELDAPRFDETLLAVIGILDTIKLEENVAAWMKHGGLVDSSVAAQPLIEDAEEVDDVQDDDLDEEDRRTSMGSTASSSSSLSISDKRPEANLPQSPSANEFPPSSQVVDSEMGHDRPSSPQQDEDRREQESTGVPIIEGATGPLWFQDPRIMAFWADRGREACKVLEILVRTDL